MKALHRCLIHLLNGQVLKLRAENFSGGGQIIKCVNKIWVNPL